MAITLPSGFKITSQEPIDNRLVMTKEEMLNMVDAKMPDNYLVICKDDGELYIYNKNATTTSSTTGKFTRYEDIIDLPAAIQKSMSSTAGKAAMEEAVASTLPGALEETMSDTESAKKIADAMFDSEQFTTNVDNKVTLEVDKAIQCIEAIDGMA